MGGGVQPTNLEVAKNILKLLGLGEDKIEFVKDRLGHDRRYAIDYSKIKKELGWSPEVNFEEGMKKTAEWYKNNEKWWKKLKSKIL